MLQRPCEATPHAVCTHSTTTEATTVPANRDAWSHWRPHKQAPTQQYTTMHHHNQPTNQQPHREMCYTPIRIITTKRAPWMLHIHMKAPKCAHGFIAGRACSAQEELYGCLTDVHDNRGPMVLLRQQARSSHPTTAPHRASPHHHTTNHKDCVIAAAPAARNAVRQAGVQQTAVLLMVVVSAVFFFITDKFN